MKRLLVLLAMVFAADSMAVSPAVQTPNVSAAQWKAMQKQAFDKSETIFTRAQKMDGLLAQYRTMSNAYDADNSPAFRIIFSQYLSWYQTYIGDYAGARRSYSIRQVAEANDAPSPLTDARFQQKPALDAIAALAKDRQAVFFNEAHNLPITRTLTIQMLERLRKEGFDYFAAETLYESDDKLQQRGYPTSESGFYVEEPLYAEMIREAIRLGYKVVAFDSTTDAGGDAREREQAKHLYDRVFFHNPKARLVVNSGYAHTQKDGKYLDGKAMAFYFKQATGIEPLSIEQTMMLQHEIPEHDHPYFRAAFATTHPEQPVVYVDTAGKPWSLKPAWYDVSVFFPPESMNRERPTWLGLNGMRLPYSIGSDVCDNRFPCLIEARYAEESDAAIPADRIMLTTGARPTETASNFNVLYLRPGRYRVTGKDVGNRQLGRSNITVGDAPATGTRS
jgi:hypothetical protein